MIAGKVFEDGLPGFTLEVKEEAEAKEKRLRGILKKAGIDPDI